MIYFRLDPHTDRGLMSNCLIGLYRMFLRRAPMPWPVLAMITTIGLSACADGTNAPLLDTSESRLGPASASARINRLRVGDKLRITVFGEKDLSGDFEVNASGKVSLPLAGEIQAEGLALPQFRDAITSRLSQGYLKSPRVTVEGMNYRPIYVHGEVRNAGEYPFRSGLRLRDVIALSGGFTYRATQSYVLIVRDGKPGEFKVPLDTNIEILPGDNIRVTERFF